MYFQDTAPLTPYISYFTFLSNSKYICVNSIEVYNLLIGFTFATLTDEPQHYDQSQMKPIMLISFYEQRVSRSGVDCKQRACFCI